MSSVCRLFLFLMAAVLVSRCCYHHYYDPSDLGRARHDISFSGSISGINSTNLNISQNVYCKAKELSRFVAEVRPEESSKLGSNGRAIKMVPTREVMRNKGVSPPNGKPVNGSKVAVNGSKVAVNGSKVFVNGASLVKRDSTSSLVKPQKKKTSDELPFTEELTVLPSDEGFSWAKDDYSSWQRTVHIWSFVLTFQLRILFDNATWAYPGGFTEDKQVLFVNYARRLFFLFLILFVIICLYQHFCHALISFSYLSG